MMYFLSVFIGRSEEATEYAEKGLEIAQKIANSKWRVPLSGRMCLSYLALGRYDEALRWTQALPACKWRSMMLSGILMESGEYEQSEKHLLDALNNYHFHRIEYLQTYSTLIGRATQTGNIEKAWGYVQRGLQ